MAQASAGGQVSHAESLRSEIDRLTAENRTERSAARERRLLQLRHEAGVELLESASRPQGDYPAPAFDELGAGPIPEITRDRLSPELVRAAILRSGCLLVRGMVDPDVALQFGEGIERALRAREAQRSSPESPEAGDDGFFEAFEAKEQYDLASRMWVNEAGGVWAADSPRLAFEMLELFDGAGLTPVIRDYLAEDPLFSVQKCTLRKVAPSAGNGHPGWHQDGRFLGDVRALNVWLTLTRCGEDAPGLYLVPRRLDECLPTGTEGAIFDWVVSPAMVEEARGDVEILKPEFEPGDAMLFDDLFLHSTAADPAMPNHRYAIESWFFGRSGFPGQYAPLAL